MCFKNVLPAKLARGLATWRPHPTIFRHCLRLCFAPLPVPTNGPAQQARALVRRQLGLTDKNSLATGTSKHGHGAAERGARQTIRYSCNAIRVHVCNAIRVHKIHAHMAMERDSAGVLPPSLRGRALENAALDCGPPPGACNSSIHRGMLGEKLVDGLRKAGIRELRGNELFLTRVANQGREATPWP